MKSNITELSKREFNVVEFKRLYEQDRFKARVICFEKKPYEEVVNYNNVKPGTFQIFETVKSYGVSVSMKMFAHYKDKVKFIVSPGSFYLSDHSKIFPISVNFIPDKYLSIFIEHYPWIRFLKDENLNTLQLNQVVKNKLYSLEKALRFLYKCNYPSALIIRKYLTVQEFKEVRKALINIDNINEEILKDDNILKDTCHLAFIMNEKVNSAWSEKRLKQEHDRLSVEYTSIIMDSTNRPLNIHPAIIDALPYIDGDLIPDLKSLAIEGKTQKHCVASYSTDIDNGRCAIFKIKEYTGEIRIMNHTLVLRQLRGRFNKDAPEDLKQSVQDRLNMFNKKHPDSFLKPFNKLNEQVYRPEIELPF